MNSIVDRAAADVEAHGWHVLTVSGEGSLPYAFSIGFDKTFDHPEVLIIGLPQKTSHQLLNIVGSKVSTGARFAPGTPYLGLLERFPCEFRPVPASAYPTYLGAALGFYGAEPFSAVQLVWPDREGMFPWDASASESFRKSQPVLA
jgi:hypothetical protein